MNTTELRNVAWNVAKMHGYRRKGVLLWKSGQDLTVILHLQKSAWSKGLYVNWGVTPTAMVIKPYPPGVEYWPVGGRAKDFESPFHNLFDQLESDDNDQLKQEDVREAFVWLLGFLQNEYGNAEAVRQRVLRGGDSPEFIIEAWASGQLKEPWEYFKHFGNTGYYKRTT